MATKHAEKKRAGSATSRRSRRTRPEVIFTKDAETIARTMAREEVGPEGDRFGDPHDPVLHLDRAGKNLPTGRKRELEKAMKLLQAKER